MPIHFPYILDKQTFYLNEHIANIRKSFKIWNMLWGKIYINGGHLLQHHLVASYHL